MTINAGLVCFFFRIIDGLFGCVYKFFIVPLCNINDFVSRGKL